jgi:phosphate transport system substrate-binding protein
MMIGPWLTPELRLHGQQVEIAVPAYEPVAIQAAKDQGYVQPDASVRIVGPADLQSAVDRLNGLFMKMHPGFKLTYVPANSLAAIDCLIFDSTALAFSEMDYAPSLTYSDIVHGEPFSIRVAHGSLKAGARLSPLAVIVNRDNPMTSISFKQLTDIFSQSPHGRVFARWSQAGVHGPLAALDILPVGLPWTDHYPSEDNTFGEFFFLHKLGADEPVRSYKMYRTYAEVEKAVEENPNAIGITTLNRVTPAMKVLAIKRGDLKSASLGTPDDIREGEYPLDRYLRVYARVTSGKPLDPMVREYLLLLLSKEGQQIIADDSQGYIPLNPYELHEDLSSFR